MDMRFFEGCKTSFHIPLQGIGFKWRKDNRRKVDYLNLCILMKFSKNISKWFIGALLARQQQKSVKTTKMMEKGNKNGFILAAELLFSSKSKRKIQIYCEP
ncbi:uncharacterized protein LOC143191421 [Rhynchophorus ferrugineus]|uniref:uncharacterized protein LOC143191421 n=1 Tax=Rhynchophorus ferrugineus TaxID=354439 RepID=UPI003FCE258E